MYPNKRREIDRNRSVATDIESIPPHPTPPESNVVEVGRVGSLVNLLDDCQLEEGDRLLLTPASSPAPAAIPTLPGRVLVFPLAHQYGIEPIREMVVHLRIASTQQHIVRNWGLQNVAPSLL